jgi:NADH dehydrogenase FAD-containing subunit
MAEKLNIIIVGASYLGCKVARALAKSMPQDLATNHRILLIERNSHFSHLFAFPRFAVMPKHEHKAFIPMNKIFSEAQCDTQIICATVETINQNEIVLDRDTDFGRKLPWHILVMATGSKLPPPANMPTNTKLDSVQYLKNLQERIRTATRIGLIGGGAVGVQIATDIKSCYPDKEIHLIHSRDRLMSRFDPSLGDVVIQTCKELGINVHLESRAKVPDTDGPCIIQLESGRTIPVDFYLQCTGQVINSEPIHDLAREIINADGTIHVLPTLQLEKHPRILAVGDVNDLLQIKSVRPALGQVEVAQKNIISLLQGETPEATFENNAAGIHLTLGFKRDVYCKQTQDGSSTANIEIVDDEGLEDMGVEFMWDDLGADKKDFWA